MIPKLLPSALVASTVLASLAVGCAGARSPADARASNRQRATEELSAAAQIIADMKPIPAADRARARCVAVVPSLVRAGFVVGARHGEGTATCRTPSGWSAPFYFTVSGGSAGPQIGVESSDLVMLVMSERGIQSLLRSSFSIGADVSAAAGPVGGAAQAGTDPTLTAEILSYSRSRGLFAGAELGGAVVAQDHDANAAIYGETASTQDLIAGKVPAPPEAKAFLDGVASAFPSGAAEAQGR